MRATDDDRPTLCELVGTAVANGQSEVDFKDSAALGAATLMLPGVKLDSPLQASWHERRKIAACLWRAKYGEPVRKLGDVVRTDPLAGREAAMLLSAWMAKQAVFGTVAEEYEPSESRLLWFAAMVVHEWVHDRCSVCGGIGLKGIDKDKAARNSARLGRCEACRRHPGRARIDHVARGEALEVAAGVYDRHWKWRFGVAHTCLANIVKSIAGPLARQIGLAIATQDD